MAARTASRPPDDRPGRRTSGGAGIAVFDVGQTAKLVAMKPAVDMVLVGKYRLRHRVGRGPIGEVWAAAEVERRAWVAVELINPELHRDAPMLARLQESAELSLRLSDPGLRAATDFAEDPRLGPFMVLELLEGASLGLVMADRGVLAPAHAAWVIMETAFIVERLHAAGRVHGNLAAEQVFVQRSADPLADPRVRLLAPGLSRFDAASTMRTTIVPGRGVPSSLAPEQLENGSPRPSTDVWALGSLLYQLLVGHAPFARTTAVATIQAIAMAEPPVLPPGSPGPVSQAILDCLSPDPASRPRLDQLRAALSPYATPLPRAWIDAYRLDLGPAPGPVAPPTNPDNRAKTAPDDPFAVDMHAERDTNLGTAPTLIADRGTPDPE